MTRRVVRCTIEMDMIEGENFNTIGFDEDPIEYATEEQAHEWAKNYFIEYLQDILSEKLGLPLIEDYIQTKIVEEAS